MGATAAEMLRAVGFRVRVWSRTGRRRVDGVESFAGAEGLDAFLGGTEILVNLLPLTPETEGLVDAIDRYMSLTEKRNAPNRPSEGDDYDRLACERAVCPDK